MMERVSCSTLTMWLWLVVAVTSLVIGSVSSSSSSSSFPDNDSTDVYSAMSQILHSNRRAKRMNQISCNCCSNSFNTHCCLTCMHRLGKRGGAGVLSNSQTPFVSIPSSIDDLEPEYPDTDFRADQAVLGRPCMCCLYQMKVSPLADLTPCCQQCKNNGVDGDNLL